MKRLIVCCDGTWNDADQGSDFTNVSRLAWAVEPVDRRWREGHVGGHALLRPVYKVEVHPPDAAVTPTGLPVFDLVYRNDDGGPGYGRGDSPLRPGAVHARVLRCPPPSN